MSSSETKKPLLSWPFFVGAALCLGVAALSLLWPALRAPSGAAKALHLAFQHADPADLIVFHDSGKDAGEVPIAPEDALFLRADPGGLSARALSYFPRVFVISEDVVPDIPGQDLDEKHLIKGWHLSIYKPRERRSLLASVDDLDLEDFEVKAHRQGHSWACKADKTHISCPQMGGKRPLLKRKTCGDLENFRGLEVRGLPNATTKIKIPAPDEAKSTELRWRGDKTGLKVLQGSAQRPLLASPVSLSPKAPLWLEIGPRRNKEPLCLSPVWTKTLDPAPEVDKTCLQKSRETASMVHLLRGASGKRCFDE